MKFDEIFAVDKKREEGAWVTSGFRDLPGLKIKVRGDGCSEHLKRANEIFTEATTAQREDPAFEVEMEKKLLLDVILIDWQIEDRPFDREAAKAAIETATFREAVKYASRVVAARGADTLEADKGN